MLRFIAKRVLGLIVILFCVITITFFLVRLMPGGPFDRERKLPEHIEKQLLAKYKLDGPLPEQYINYLGDLLHGDLRLSTKYRSRSVNEILADSLPVSGLLGGIAFCAATIGGVLLGSLAAAKQHTWIDRNAMLAALFAISLPSFVIGPLLVLVFAIYIPLLPGRRMGYSPESHPSFDHARCAVHGLHRSSHPGKHARGIDPGLHSHGARKGPQRKRGHL